MAHLIMAAFLLLPADGKDLLHLVGRLILLSCLVCLTSYRQFLSAHDFFWTSKAQYENLWIFGNCTSCHTLVRKKLSSVYELWSRKYVIILKCLSLYSLNFWMSVPIYDASTRPFLFMKEDFAALPSSPRYKKSRWSKICWCSCEWPGLRLLWDEYLYECPCSSHTWILEQVSSRSSDPRCQWFFL